MFHIENPEQSYNICITDWEYVAYLETKKMHKTSFFSKVMLHIGFQLILKFLNFSDKD